MTSRLTALRFWLTLTRVSAVRFVHEKHEKHERANLRPHAPVPFVVFVFFVSFVDNLHRACGALQRDPTPDLTLAPPENT